MTRIADRGAICRRMLVDYLGANSRVNGAGTSQLVCGEEQRHLGMCEILFFEQGLRDSFAHPPAVSHSSGERFVHSPAGFVRHSERAVDESTRNIF